MSSFFSDPPLSKLDVYESSWSSFDNEKFMFDDLEKTLGSNESRYIALLVVSGCIKKLFSIACVNIYFSQSIVNYLFSIFFSIDLKVLGYPTMLMSWFINFNAEKMMSVISLTITFLNINEIFDKHAPFKKESKYQLKLKNKSWMTTTTHFFIRKIFVRWWLHDLG